MKLIKTNKKEFLKFLKNIYQKGSIDGAVIRVGKKLVKAVGTNVTESMYFQVNHMPIEVFNPGVVDIVDLAELIKFVDRAEDEFTLSLDKNKLKLKGKKTITMTLPTAGEFEETEMEMSLDLKTFIFKDGEDTYQFSKSHIDVSDIDFKDVLKDFKLISGISEPRFIFSRQELIIEHIETGNKVVVPLLGDFVKEVTLDSGELAAIFKTNPENMLVFSEKDGKPLWLIVTNKLNFYVMRGLTVATGNKNKLPF